MNFTTKVYIIIASLSLGLSTSNYAQNTMDQKILFVLSSAKFYGDSEIRSTNHFPEIIYAYEEFNSMGYSIDFLSPEGGQVAIGYIGSSDSLLQAYLFNSEFMDLLRETKKPEQVSAEEYVAVFYPGGGSAMTGVHDNKQIEMITRVIYSENEGFVSAVCHGIAGIANVRLSDGSFLVDGKSITGFPDVFERKEAPYYQNFPFSIEKQVSKNGGKFIFSEKGWDAHTISDGRIITGQDPSGSALVARKVIELIEKRSDF